ncbi:B3 domain-containing transcription factor VRN1-like [Neltuma alba]|uniref:B3 domain-containing transcription factor VRN1-like n=1 Tax=Neltuma alba TaxID=207710 RepID=UPI0010A3D5BF|nr:B3 domain-containing transcription factor VRN1-like [Prosopis alba]
MELKKSGNEVWFCKGWDEFVKYYSISFGFFLMFKYEGNSQFGVVIFDISAAEIHYPYKINSQTEKHRTKRTSSSDQCGYNTTSQRHELEEEEIIDLDDETALNLGKSGDKDRSEQGHCSKMKKRSLSKKQRAMEAAQKFKPANRSFTVTIRASHLNRRYLDVPASFWKDNMGKKSPTKLQDSNGRKWEVNYAKKQTSMRIWKGWISFARANNVKEGDVCVFELIKRKDYIFRVTIFSC